MDLTKASLLREMLSGTELGNRTDGFAHSLRRFTTRTGGLLLFGPPEDEPWHLTAHLDDELHRAGVDDLRPALVRWSPPPEAPPHLSIGLDRLRETGRGQSLLVVSEAAPRSTLLERVNDVRRRGATIFSIDNGDKELASLSHESLVPELLVPAAFGTGWVSHRADQDQVYDQLSPEQLSRPGPDPVEPDEQEQADESLAALREAVAGFEMTQHLVSVAVADGDAGQAAWRRRLRTFIERLSGETG